MIGRYPVRNRDKEKLWFMLKLVSPNVRPRIVDDCKWCGWGYKSTPSITNKSECLNSSLFL